MLNNNLSALETPRILLIEEHPMFQKMTHAMLEILGVKFLSLFTNGTIALVTALQALRITGEVITTPYSFVATAHSLLWNGNKPVFVDVEPGTLNIDPAKIAAAITPATSAIMPVHVYGHPCDVDAIEAIAKRHNLKVIYDAAHAFGVQCHCGSVLNHGDLSVLSFHATKVFNTFEGGAIVSKDADTKRRIDQLKNFGFVDEVTVVEAGINGKMSEVNAAFGLLQLKHIDIAIASRKEIDRTYRINLQGIKGIELLKGSGEQVSNYAYFPILINDDYPLSRDAMYEKLKRHGVNGRRYFYPLITDFAMYKDFASAHTSNLPEANSAAKRVLCLPIYPLLSLDDVSRITDLFVL